MFFCLFVSFCGMENIKRSFQRVVMDGVYSVSLEVMIFFQLASGSPVSEPMPYLNTSKFGFEKPPEKFCRK